MSGVLARETRIRSKEEFSLVFSSGRRYKTAHTIFIYKANNLNCSRLGVVVSKKCFKNAVARNYVKRLHKESFRAIELSGNYDIVAVSKKSVSNLAQEKLYENTKKQWNTFVKCLSSS